VRTATDALTPPTHTHPLCARPHISYIADVKVAIDKATSRVGEMVFVVKTNDTKLLPASVFSCGTPSLHGRRLAQLASVPISVMPPLTALSSMGGSCVSLGVAGLAIDPTGLAPTVTSPGAPAGCTPSTVVVARTTSGWFSGNTGNNAAQIGNGDNYRVGTNFNTYKNFFVLNLAPIAGWTSISAATFSATNPSATPPTGTWAFNFYSADATAIADLSTPKTGVNGQAIYSVLTNGPALGSTVPADVTAALQVVDLTPGAATLLQYAGQTVAIASSLTGGGEMFAFSQQLPANAVTLTLTGC